MDYISFGSGSKQLVVILGLSLKSIAESGPMLKNTFRTFSGDYTITVLDREDDIPKGYTVHQMAEDSLQILHSLGINSAYFIGNSLGGMITMDILVNHPDVVIKAALTSTTAWISPHEETVTLWRNLADEGKTQELVKSMLNMIFSDDFLVKYEALLLRMYDAIPKERLNKISVSSQACLEFDLRDRLAEIRDIKKDALMVMGARGDKVFDSNRMSELAEIMSCNIFLYDAMYGHAVCDEAPDFYEHIYRFFK